VIFRKSVSFLLLLILTGLVAAHANEVIDGNIRINFNERTGAFSLFLLNPQTQRYEPLFNSRDQRASYTSILINGNVYRLGDRYFQPKFEWQNGIAAFVYESALINITMSFTPVTTLNSSASNGVMITYTIHNISNLNNSIGLRILIDTMLGEGWGRIPFITDSFSIRNETLLEIDSGQKYWISRNNNISLMGSFVNPLDNTAAVPDFLHFAGWRRLNNSQWRLRESQGRSFSSDSAVGYYFEPVLLDSGGTLTYTIFLTAEDIEWYNMIHESAPDAFLKPQIADLEKDFRPVEEIPNVNIANIEQAAFIVASSNNEHPDILILLRLQEILRQFINGEIDLNEQDLMEIENAINRYR